MSGTKVEPSAIGLAELTANTPSPNGTDPRYHLTINGKAVHLKRRLPLREGHRLGALTKKASETADYLDQVPIACLLIESWDFPGDPSKPESYDELDTLTEVIPLMNAIGEHISASQPPKNSEPTPTTR